MHRTLIALLTTPLLACGVAEGLYLEDDVGASDSDLDIHGPYARGSVVTLGVGGWRSGQVDETWDIVPDDDGVMVVIEGEEEPDDGDEDDDDGLTVELRAATSGTTAVSLVDPDGDVKDRISVEVVVPDTLTVHVATAERMDMPELAPEDCGVRIVAGGTGGLVAQYWLGDTEVFGNEVLSTLTDDAIDADVDHSYSGKNLDWLQLTPTQVGTQVVDLLVDGVHLESVTIDGLSADSVVSAAFLGGDETDADEGDAVELLVQAFDADDCPVYGAAWTWHVDGELQDEVGDLYHYDFDEDVTTSLEATFGDLEKATSVHGVGSVQDSNATGCSALAAPAALAPALLGLLALVRRRDD